MYIIEWNRSLASAPPPVLLNPLNRVVNVPPSVKEYRPIGLMDVFPVEMTLPTKRRESEDEVVLRP